MLESWVCLRLWPWLLVYEAPFWLWRALLRALRSKINLRRGWRMGMQEAIMMVVPSTLEGA